MHDEQKQLDDDFCLARLFNESAYQDSSTPSNPRHLSVKNRYVPTRYSNLKDASMQPNQTNQFQEFPCKRLATTNNRKDTTNQYQRKVKKKITATKENKQQSKILARSVSSSENPISLNRLLAKTVWRKTNPKLARCLPQAILHNEEQSK